MFKKGLVTLVCLTVMSALWAWAATTYSISTKITSIGTYKAADGSYKQIEGGDIKVRGGVAQTYGIKYSNFTTQAVLDVVVTPKTGYKVSALSATGAGVVTPLPALGAGAVTVQVKKPAINTVGTAAYIVATFAPEGLTATESKNWQLQVLNNTKGGSIKIQRPTNTDVIWATFGKSLVKSYVDTTPVTVTVTPDLGWNIDYLIVDGVKTFYKNDTVRVVTVDASTGSRIKNVVAGYQKKSLQVTTQTVMATTTTVDGATITRPVANGIEPANPVADPSGTVRLVVTPTGTNNKVTGFSVTSGTYGAITYADRYGKALAGLPPIGPVKVTITGITTDIAVAATYGFDAASSATYASCTQTCHADKLLVADSVRAADTNWLLSQHRANNVECVTCHYDQVAKTAMPGADFSTPAKVDALCATCHIAGSNPNYLHTAAQNVCSTCHTFGDVHNPVKAAVAGSLAAKHTGGSFGGKAQYVTQGITCSNCHVTGVAPAIMAAWGESKHGAVDGAAWMTSSSHDWPVYSSGACKRCHTGIGFKNSVDGTTIAQTAGVAGQVLDCKTCHTDVATGAVRANGAVYTLPYQIMGTDTAADTITVPGKSGVCIPCHAGRGSGVGITAATAANFNGRFPSHYFNAGASLFAASGYHFAGQVYNQGFHKTMGGEGACVTCHMSNDAGKGHTFEAVTKTDGVITAINTAAACAGCHADMTPAKLEADKASFVAALNTLKAALETNQTAFYNSADGGFYNESTFTNKKTSYTSVDAQGAAYNYWLLEHAEAGMYVHNRAYGLKLIADSIEFLNTGAVTGNFSNTAIAAAKAGHDVAAPTSAGCATCHFTGSAAPVTATTAEHTGGTVLVKAQFVAQSLTCANCHAGNNTAILNQWSESGHGDVAGDPWFHYDWAAGGTRLACQRCHTATGFINNATGVAAGTGLTGGKAAQVLACSACHSDVATGAVRDLSALNTVDYSTADADTVIYPNVAASNVCISCHAGMGANGNTIKNQVEVAAGGTVDFNNLGAIQPHYLAAAGTLMGRTGYEFVGATYTDGAHKNIGVADFKGTGNSGPCVACHMTDAKNHTFEVSANATCAKCHEGLTNVMIEEAKVRYNAAVEELNVALKAKGIWFIPSYPYFVADNGCVPNAGGTACASYDATAGDGVLSANEMSRANGFKKWEDAVPGDNNGKDTMGAAFNFNLLVHEPGAFAHNKAYAYQLIQSSIDFLADGVIDGDVNAVVNAAATSKEIAEGTGHPAAIVAAQTQTDCASCHAPAPHFTTDAGNQAAFVGQQITCANCHANGDVAANQQILVQYAESGHGDVKGAAWINEEMYNNSCVRCHSTTGFIAGGAPATAFTGTALAPEGQQVLACAGCHMDLTTGEVRTKGPITVAYKSKTLVDATNNVWSAATVASFPSVGAGNDLCIYCHAGRESGESVLALADMTNASFKNPHYLGAAGMMYAKLAFIDFTDRNTVIGTSTYGKSLTSNEDGGALTSSHRKLGTPALTGSYAALTDFTTGGPCVTCHMQDNAGKADHTWEINGNAFTNLCSKCHTKELDLVLTADNFKEHFIEAQAEGYEQTIDLALDLLKTKYGVEYDNATHPYFFAAGAVHSSTTGLKNWTTAGGFLTTPLSQDDAKKLMGACLNIKLMKADPAAYAHARTYARRVLYDTIDWLDDGIINLSAGQTAIDWSTAKGNTFFTKGGSAFTGGQSTAGTTVTSGTSEGMIYLLSWDRNTGAWKSPERP